MSGLGYQDSTRLPSHKSNMHVHLFWGLEVGAYRQAQRRNPIPTNHTDMHCAVLLSDV